MTSISNYPTLVRLKGQLALLLLTLASMSHAQTPYPQMLQLVNQATLQHPLVQVQQARAQASDEDLDSAKRRRWPNLYALGSSQTGGQASVGAELTLFDFGKSTALIEQAEANRSAQGFRVGEAQIAITLKVIEAWHIVQLAQEKRRVLNQAKTQLEQLRLTMERRVTAQVSPAIELELVAARTRQLDAEDSNQLTLIQQNASRLKQWTGQTLNFDESSLAEYLVYRERLLKSHTVIESQLIPQPNNKSHPSIKAAQHDAIAAVAETRAANAKVFPEIFARIEKATGDSLGRERKAVIGLRWESGGGLSNFSQVKAQIARAQALELSAAAVELEINEQLTTQRQSLRNTLAKAERFAEAAVSAQQIFESYERLFTVGRKSWLEVINALRESYEVRLSQSESLNEASSLVWLINAKINAIGKEESNVR